MDGAPAEVEFKPTKLGMEKLGDLKEVPLKENKNLIVWDKNGQADSFFTYHSSVVDLVQLIKKVNDGTETKENVLEECRKGMVAAMRTGKLLCLYIGNLDIDFVNEYTSDETNFPTSLIFDRYVWKDHDTYMKTIRHDENQNDMGNAGAFFQDEKFGVCILAKF